MGRILRAFAVSLAVAGCGELGGAGHTTDLDFNDAGTPNAAARAIAASPGPPVLVKDIRPGPEGSYPGRFRALGGTVYFTAHDDEADSTDDDGGYGEPIGALWKTDGTAAGTVLVEDLNPGRADSIPSSIIPVGSTLYFQADDGKTGKELWKIGP